MTTLAALIAAAALLIAPRLRTHCPLCLRRKWRSGLCGACRKVVGE